MLITGNFQDDCLQRPEAVLKKLQDEGSAEGSDLLLYTSEKKWKFCEDNVEHLGHRIDAEGYHHAKYRVRAIRSAPISKRMSELKMLAGEYKLLRQIHCKPIRCVFTFA